MRTNHLADLQRVYAVSQRTVRRWCEAGRVPGAYRPKGRSHWRVRTPQGVEAWRAAVLKSLGQPTAATVRPDPLPEFDFKLKIRGDVERWPKWVKRRFAEAMVEPLAALVRIEILDPAQIDPRQKNKDCMDGLRLALSFKSGAGRDAYRNGRVEEMLVHALERHGFVSEVGWRASWEQGRGMTEAERFGANRAATIRTGQGRRSD